MYRKSKKLPIKQFFRVPGLNGDLSACFNLCLRLVGKSIDFEYIQNQRIFKCFHGSLAQFAYPEKEINLFELM